MGYEYLEAYTIWIQLSNAFYNNYIQRICTLAQYSYTNQNQDVLHLLQVFGFLLFTMVLDLELNYYMLY